MSFTQLVIFSLDNEEYGIDINFTREIIRIPKTITKIPDMPSYIEGIINLRGKVIPIIDLKMKFSLKSTEKTNNSRLLILDLENDLIGIIVDDISEVIKIKNDAIEEFDIEILNLNNNCIKKIARIDERLILLLNSSIFKNEILTK